MDPNQNQQNSSHQVDNLELLRGLREQRRSNEDQVQARIDAMSKENPQMRLSPREQALMRECNNESFWQRSAPLSLLMGTAVTVAARTGKIKGTRVFPKSLAAAMIGYFAGKISYMPICRDKFLTQEPHGDMAKAIRKAQNLPEPAVSEFASNSPPEVEASNQKCNQQILPLKLYIQNNQVTQGQCHTKNYVKIVESPIDYPSLKNTNLYNQIGVNKEVIFHHNSL